MVRLIATVWALAEFASMLAAQPKVKSQQERDAFAALQNEPNPDERIQKADDFITRFKDSELKSMVLDMAADTEELKGDSDRAIRYAQRALSANQLDYQAMVLISGELARRTGDGDADKNEKLDRAAKLASEAIVTVQSASNPDSEHINGARWADLKRDILAQAHDNLGLIAFVRGSSDVAVREFKIAVDEAKTADPLSMIRLAAAYNQAGRPSDALILLNKVLALPNLSSTVRQFAENEQKHAKAQGERSTIQP